ncbi:hypothetical protein J6590_052366 [Homalodisca vitripennis]|nr:hypothetical protein J6590_052366 [Homalodisca vitripennis]
MTHPQNGLVVWPMTSTEEAAGLKPLMCHHFALNGSLAASDNPGTSVGKHAMRGLALSSDLCTRMSCLCLGAATASVDDIGLPHCACNVNQCQPSLSPHPHIYSAALQGPVIHPPPTTSDNRATPGVTATVRFHQLIVAAFGGVNRARFP